MFSIFLSSSCLRLLVFFSLVFSSLYRWNHRPRDFVPWKLTFLCFLSELFTIEMLAKIDSRRRDWDENVEDEEVDAITRVVQRTEWDLSECSRDVYWPGEVTCVEVPSICDIHASNLLSRVRESLGLSAGDFLSALLAEVCEWMQSVQISNQKEISLDLRATSFSRTLVTFTFLFSSIRKPSRSSSIVLGRAGFQTLWV